MNITLGEIEDVLDRAGLKHKRAPGGILSQCPMHADSTSGLNCQISENGFCFCHSHGCNNGKDKGFWLDEVYEFLKNKNKDEWKKQIEQVKPKYNNKVEKVENKVQVNLYELWKSLEPLTENVAGKNIPFEFLNKLGWRKWKMWQKIGDVAYPEGWFIPYFGATGKTMPYAQIRHDKFAEWQKPDDIRRFSFIRGATPTWHGLESLEKCQQFVCFTEGSSDRAVLEFAGIPCLGLPAGKNVNKVQSLGNWCEKHNRIPVYCGDNDQVGDDLLEAMDKMGIRYRVARPPKEYKDYGDMFEAVGIEPIKMRLSSYIIGEKPNWVESVAEVVEETDIERIKRENAQLFDIMFKE